MSARPYSTFKPAASLGWLSLVVLLAFMVLPLAAIVRPGSFSGPEAPGVWITLAIMVPLAAFFLLTLASLPSMRYQLTDDALVLSCGRILRYRIPYAEITDVRRSTLTPSLWSSMRLPGLALWGVPYADRGTVYMCATRMASGVLLVETRTRTYGITPAEEGPFVSELLARLPR